MGTIFVDQTVMYTDCNQSVVLTDGVVKVKMSLSMPQRCIGAWGALVHSLLTSVLGGGEWSASRLGRFSPGEGTGYPFKTRLGGPQRWSGH